VYHVKPKPFLKIDVRIYYLRRRRMAASQGVLFSEPLYTETGVWCELAPGIDPAQWAEICLYRVIARGTYRAFMFRERGGKPLKWGPDSYCFNSTIANIAFFMEAKTESIKGYC
ncbi:MAG: hypothetical protein JW902_12930, partial [Syntrophaceae bacterium]|nr:hypothetical protein [Syntrophaceae bacterium]